MALSYQPSAMFQPQYIADNPAALIFSPKGGAAVPAGYTYQISVMRVVNVSGAPVKLTMWRVPVGGAADNQNLVVPGSVVIPSANSSSPWFDVEVLWGAVIDEGGAIWAEANVASALSITADGLVIQ